MVKELVKTSVKRRPTGESRTERLGGTETYLLYKGKYFLKGIYYSFGGFPFPVVWVFVHVNGLQRLKSQVPSRGLANKSPPA